MSAVAEFLAQLPSTGIWWLQWTTKFTHLNKWNEWTTPFFVVVMVTHFSYIIFKILRNHLISSDFHEPLGVYVSQEDPNSNPNLNLKTSVFLWTGLLSSSKCMLLSLGRTSGYSMFWRQLTQSRGKEERWVFISIVANFPNGEPNYSTPPLSLCL